MAKILVVDDEEELRKVITNYLKKEGHQVFEADNGKTGLKIIEKEDPDIILCDILMPEMNGYQFIEKVKAHPIHRYTPVIMLTGLSLFNIQHSVISTGADDYLIKPVDFDQLKLRIISMQRIKDLYKALLEKDNRIQKELDMAQKIQYSFLPSICPEFNGVEIVVRYYPTERLSGDLYDLKKISSDKCFFIVADISGHGVPAALVMSTVKILLSKYLEVYSEKLEELLYCINNELISFQLENIFITAFAGIFDFKKKTLEFISAGHPHALHIKKEKISLLKSNSTVLGMFPLEVYKKRVINYSANDKFLFYTDGLTGIRNIQSKKLFRLKDLLAFIKKNRKKPMNSILGTLENDIIKFSEMYHANDDVAIMGFSIK
ncbi:MAG: SpoIIE family protein phosphatase [Spirochaetes bacterium]|nr:SpoIIE family protein phosphatase [Spirochaetota bacterium]